MTTISPPAPYTPAPRVTDDDGDYEYYWSRGGLDIPIPRWLAEILDIPLAVRMEIFMVGVCTGLIIALIALVIALYSAVG